MCGFALVVEGESISDHTRGARMLIFLLSKGRILAMDA